MKRLLWFLFASLLPLPTTLADPVHFSHVLTGDISGTLDGVPFNTDRLLIAATADSANRGAILEGFQIEHDVAVVSIPGLGDLRLTSRTSTWVGYNVGKVGIMRVGGILGNLTDGPTDPVLEHWNMRTSIEPVTGDGRILQWLLSPVRTTRGVMVLDDAFVTIRFAATVANPLELTLTSSCPGSGPVTLTATGAAEGEVGFVYARRGMGARVVPGGMCARTVLDLQPPVVLVGLASGDPAMFVVENVPAFNCGRTFVQAIDGTTCRTSNVVVIE